MQEEKVHHLKLVQANQNLLTSTIISPEVALHCGQNSVGARRISGLVMCVRWRLGLCRD